MNNELVSNRKARHEYEILETFEAGMILLGTEIKSLRNHGGSLQEAYIYVKGGKLWLINCHIAPYSYTKIFNHEERRPKELLMHKKEIEKLAKATGEKGLAIVPLSIYLNRRGIAKISIALAKGKKSYDKRQSIKEKEAKRSIQRGSQED